MGDCPEGMTLERRDNNRGYSKENCKWATRKEQCNNRSSNVVLTIGGRSMNISQWAAELGKDHRKIRSRIRSGWTPEEAVMT
jgi:hypothetical protein